MEVADSVTLSPIRPGDSETMFRWINDPETVRFNAPFKPVHWANHQEWVQSLGKLSNKVVFAIRAADNLIGIVQLIDVDPINRSAELTIRIGAETHRGSGYGSLALRLAISFAWCDLNLNRVWLRVFADNTRAIRAYKKVGFVEEGVMREAAHIDGRFVDMIIFGILRPKS